MRNLYLYSYYAYNLPISFFCSFSCPNRYNNIPFPNRSRPTLSTRFGRCSARWIPEFRNPQLPNLLGTTYLSDRDLRASIGSKRQRSLAEKRKKRERERERGERDDDLTRCGPVSRKLRRRTDHVISIRCSAKLAGN